MLEVVDVALSGPNDDQIIHIHTDDEMLLLRSPHVQSMLGDALGEDEGDRGGVALRKKRFLGAARIVEAVFRPPLQIDL